MGNEMLLVLGTRRLCIDYRLDYKFSTENAVKENQK
jgi:hypothetical protein